jgi:hypothetical protein
VTGNGKAQRQVGGVPYADPRRHQDAAHAHAVVPNLQRRDRIEQIKTIVLLSLEVHRLAKPARPARQFACPRAWSQPTIARHLLQPFYRLQRT